MPTQPIIYAETSRGALLTLRPRAALCGVSLLRIWLDLPPLMSGDDPFFEWWATSIRTRFDPDCMVSDIDGKPLLPALALQLGVSNA